jgi:hypothetical protein
MRVRRLAGLTAAGIAGLVVAPAIGLAPAAAADPCEKPLEYGATAAADLVKLGLLDFRPVGLGLGPVADVTLMSTNSGMNAMTPVNSAAAARLLDAKLFGVPLPPGPLTKTVSQQAPPSNDEPETKSLIAQNLGLLKVGAGDLSAHATWKSGMACGKEHGKNTEASAEIANATVLPGLRKNSGLVRASLLSSATETGLDKKGDQVCSVARASVGVAEISLFAGSRSAIKIEVIKPPTLAVGTAGTKASGTVHYQAPILKITGPGGISHQINSPGDTVTLGIPSSLPLLGQAKELAKTEGLPLLGDVPLDGLLGDLNKPDATAKADQGPLPGLPALPDVPKLPPAADIIGAAPESLPVVGSGALSLLRLTIGDVESEITDQAVRAEAASLRLEVLAGHNKKTKSLVDVGLGLLSAAAVAPAPVVPAPPAVEPPPVTGGGGGLPVTGANVGVVAGVGIVLLAGGGAMLIVGRRRRISVRG